MQEKNRPRKSVTYKIILFMFVFSIILITSIISVFSFVNKLEVEDDAFNSAIITAQKVYSKLEQKKIRAQTLAMTLANVGENIQANHAANEKLIKNIIDLEGHEKFIAGGGIWPEPFKLDHSLERSSYFFSRNKDGLLEYHDDYNKPQGSGYHHKEWYVPAKFYKEGEAYWSKSYLDSYSHQPMVTVTIPMYKDKQFIGVSTIDLLLDGLHDFLEKNMKSLGGYSFILDRNEKFVTYPDLKKIRVQKDKIIDSMTFNEFVKKEPKYIKLQKALAEIDDKYFDTKAYDSKTVSLLEKESQQIGGKDAKQIASIIKEKSAQADAERLSIKLVSIENDPILNEESLAVILMQPDTHWKLVVVLPVRIILSQSNKIFNNLMVIVVVVVLLLSLMGYYVIRKIIVLPIFSMMAQLKKSSDKKIFITLESHDEIGELADIFNERTKDLIDKSDSLKELANTLEEKVELRTKELQNQHLFLNLIINSIVSGIMVIDKNCKVTMMNDAAKTMIDEKLVADPESSNCYDISHHESTPCDGAFNPCILQKVLEEKITTQVMHTQYDLDGNKKIVEITATPLFNEDGNVKSIIEIIYDVTALIEAKDSLEYQANHDALTGLPNRNLFLDRLDQSIKHAKRDNEKLAVLFLDLDNFKEVNDSLGHAIGDELLILIANKLKEAIRQSDTVSRLGGDEFTIIVDEIKDMDVVIDIILKLIESINGIQHIKEHQLYTSFSIGISIYPDDSADAFTLLKYADTAMYKAKSDGRNNYKFYTEEMTERALERMMMETQLRQSISNNQLSVHYQLQTDTQNNSCVGMEALVRWYHPELGQVAPSKFIPLAEDINFIIELDEWVMDKAIQKWSQWFAEGLNPGVLSLNLSRVRLKDKDLIQKMQTVLEKYSMDPKWLMLEVTESQIMKNPQEAIKMLQQLNSIGIRLAIDDFGTGYSSLASLKQLPIDKLKIDQSFVRDLPNDLDDAEICRTIISMAKGLNMKIIAEGVETLAQSDFLLSHGCSEVQGYLYHRPAPASEVASKLASFGS